MKRIVLLVVCSLILALGITEVGISSYKDDTVNAFRLLADGEFDRAIEVYQTLTDRYQEEYSPYLEEFPADLESYFGLAMAFAHKGNLEKAMSYAETAVSGGMPVERFLAGPRDLSKPLVTSDKFREYLDTQAIELLHGPMLSDVTDQGAEFWVRTVHEVPVEVEVSRSGEFTDIVAQDQKTTRPADDFTVVLDIEDLQPATRYFYRLKVAEAPQTEGKSFRTFPAEGEPAEFQVGFGGGAGYAPWYERMWETIDSHKLQAFLQMGDNVYIDWPKYPAVQRYAYYRRQSRPEYRKLIAQTPIYAIWDDHDFADDNSWGGPHAGVPRWKLGVWEVFKDNWNNPSYGGGEEYPGCWFDLSIGDVDFFFLDGRYYRENPATQTLL